MLSWWWELLPLWLVRLGARAGCERMRLGGREWLTARPDVLVRVPVCASVVTPNKALKSDLSRLRRARRLSALLGACNEKQGNHGTQLTTVARCHQPAPEHGRQFVGLD